MRFSVRMEAHHREPRHFPLDSLLHYFIKLAAQLCLDIRWYKSVNGPSKVRNFFYQFGTQEGVGFARQHENRLDFIGKPSVHQSHLQFILVIRYGPDSPDNDGGSQFFNKINQQTRKRCDRDILQVPDGHFQHLRSLFDAEKGSLVGISQNRHNHFVEECSASLNKVNVPVGDGVKRSRINSSSFHG
jgi:hypothetical protein